MDDGLTVGVRATALKTGGPSDYPSAIAAIRFHMIDVTRNIAGIH
jgi:hypothetical protein